MRLTRISFVALIGIGFAAVAVPAIAAPISGAMAKDPVAQAFHGEDSLFIQVQRRRGHSRHDDRRHRGRDRGRDDGAAAAGLLGGLFLGAIIANQAQQNRQGDIDYCMQRFRSYDPRSGTYLGHDGYRHRCP
jgi:hypothetical protein